MSKLRDAYENVHNTIVCLEAKVDYLESNAAVSAGYLSALSLELERAEGELTTLRRLMITRLMEKPTK